MEFPRSSLSIIDNHNQEFKVFTSANGIKHLFSAPYQPSTNGFAEWAVQSLKQGLLQITSGSVEEQLSNFLFKYWITPHATTGISPAELLMGCVSDQGRTYHIQTCPREWKIVWRSRRAISLDQYKNVSRSVSGSYRSVLILHQIYQRNHNAPTCGQCQEKNCRN